MKMEKIFAIQILLEVPTGFSRCPLLFSSLLPISTNILDMRKYTFTPLMLQDRPTQWGVYPFYQCEGVREWVCAPHYLCSAFRYELGDGMRFPGLRIGGPEYPSDIILCFSLCHISSIPSTDDS